MSHHLFVDGGRMSIGAPEKLSLLITMPALNEEKSIGSVIQAVPMEISGIRSVDVLVVDDGSTDRTREIAIENGAEVISHSRRRGVGAAFHTALAYGIEHGADIIVSIDSDGQFDPMDIPRLIEPVVAGEADFTTASRFKDSSLVPTMPRTKLWGNLLMSALISNLAGEKFYDVSCGMRCYSSRAALQLHLLAPFTYTQEVFLNLAFKHLRIVEIPLRVRGEREFGKSRVASNLWKYGFRTSQIILRCYRDYHPLRFFGFIAGLMFVVALGFGAFFAVHFLQTGAFWPHTWAGVSSGVLFALALLVAHMGIIGDMLSRHRIYLEELLFRQRRDTRVVRSTLRQLEASVEAESSKLGRAV